MSSIFSNNSETFVSEFLEDLEQMFMIYEAGIQICKLLRSKGLMLIELLVNIPLNS